MVQISIGLPVYNGEKFLRQAIESIQAQTFQDFELIISDNASTDSTEDICRSFAELDTRIEYHRQSENIGAAPNFNYLVHVSRGKYFKWAAHDDVILPSYLASCIDAMERDTDIVLCTSRVTVIDQYGDTCDDYDGVEQQFFSQTSSERLGHIIQFHKQRCYEIFGVIRASALRETDLIGGYKNGDGVLLAHLALKGKFFQVPDRLFCPRRHQAQSQRIVHDSQAYDEWFDPQNIGKINLPYWRIMSEFSRVIKAEPLDRAEKMKCCLKLMKQYFGVWHLLRGDIRRAGTRLVKKKISALTKSRPTAVRP